MKEPHPPYAPDPTDKPKGPVPADSPTGTTHDPNAVTTGTPGEPKDRFPPPKDGKD